MHTCTHTHTYTHTHTHTHTHTSSLLLPLTHTRPPKQRGIYEKVNSVTAGNRNNFRMIVKEIAPDLSVVRPAALFSAT